MLRGLWAFCVFVVATTLCGLPAALISLVHRGSDFVMRVGRLWSRSLLAATGARVTYEGLENMRAHAPCVFMSNHQSNVDIWALMRVLPLPTRFVAKQVLFRVPVLGWAMAASGFISIDRGNRQRAIRSLSLAAERIRGGRSVVLFPEGTRSRAGGLQPFKKGPFHLALEAGVPLVPVAISGSGAVLRPGSLRVRPGPVTVRFLAPVDVATYRPDRHEALRDAVHEAVERALRRPGGPPRAPRLEAESL